MLIKNVSTF